MMAKWSLWRMADRFPPDADLDRGHDAASADWDAAVSNGTRTVESDRGTRRSRLAGRMGAG